jgi:putative MATE family efflux protein
LAGAALASALLAVGYAVFIFLTYGTTATVARLIGAGRDDDATHHGIQALWLGVGAGTVVGLVLWPAAPWLVHLSDPRPAVAAAALTYFRISLWGFPAFFLVMAGTGVLRGVRDLATPLWITTSTVSFNVVLELVLIVGLGYGVGASALGTVLAKWIGALVYVLIVARRARRGGVPLRPHAGAIGQLSATALPLFIRTAALRLAFAATVAVAGRLGPKRLAAYAIAIEIWSLLAYICEGLEVAAQTLIAAALGGADADRARSIATRVIRWAVALGVVVGALLLSVHTVLPRVFTRDPTVRSLTIDSLLWVAAMQPINMAAFALDGILVGAGDLGFLAVAMIGSLAVFAPLLWAVDAHGRTLSWVWLALIGFMVTRVIGLGVRFAGHRWERVSA